MTNKMSQKAKEGGPLISLKNELLLGAVVRGELPTVRRLLDRHGADINSIHSSDINCLQLAILNGHTKLAEYLIQKGIDIHVVDSEGWSALHDAALKDNTTLVRKLISKGLSPMLTTNLGELTIDVAGSIQMEKLLCEEMCIKGEVVLARQYYFYLGLHQLDDSFDPEKHTPRLHSGIRNSSYLVARTQKHFHRSRSFTAAKCRITTGSVWSSEPNTSCPASTMVAKSATWQSRSDSTNMYSPPFHCTTFERIPNNGSHIQGSPLSAHHTTDKYKDKSVTDFTAQQQATKSSTTTHSSEGTLDSAGDLEVRPSGEAIVVNTPTARESTQVHPNQHQRGVSAINSLFRHSSFQLQIGLSLAQFNNFECSSLDDNCSTDLSDLGSDNRTTSSRTVRSAPWTRSGECFDSCTDSTNLTQNQDKHNSHSIITSTTTTTINSAVRTSPQQKPLRKAVTFGELPMTRTKTPLVGSSNGSNSSATVHRDSNTELKHRSSNNSSSSSSSRLTPAELAHLSKIFQDTTVDFNSDEEYSGEGDFEAGVRALKMKPRKSSIASPKRRASSESRRRSVTFQPEVLLHEVVIDGDAKAVSEILESGMVQDINKMSPSGLTALHQSAVDGNLDCAKTLVSKGANVNCTDCEKWTPLHAAAMTGSMEFVRFLLSAGADATIKNDDGETAYDVAKPGSIRKMLLHAMNGKNPDADDFSDGEYPGEEEEEYSHAESDSEDEEGTGGLFDANEDNKPSLKERLGLHHSAALKNNRDDSISPSPDLESADVFTANGQKSPDFHKKERELTDSTSSYGSLHEHEVEKAKEVSTESNRSNSSHEHTLGYDIEKVSDDQGISTMEGSSDCSHRSRTLSDDEGTSRDVLDSELVPGSLGYKFQEACLYCDVDSVLKLVKHKDEIDVNRVNKTSGITALHHAVLEENFALVQHIVKDYGASVQIQDTDGWTPLHAASAVGNIRIAQFLLESGAKASVLNNSCEFPVDLACDNAMEKLLKNAMLGPSVGVLIR